MPAVLRVPRDHLPPPPTPEDALTIWEELEDRAAQWWNAYEPLILQAYADRDRPPDPDEDEIDF
ncbi:MAG TPA: hypothetical protein VGK67_38850 [Myxococcales bacterium]|jgi:hypothetical protein